MSLTTWSLPQVHHDRNLWMLLTARSLCQTYPNRSLWMLLTARRPCQTHHNSYKRRIGESILLPCYTNALTLIPRSSQMYKRPSFSSVLTSIIAVVLWSCISHIVR
ncbi:uncharacterized protein LOC142775757 isoform X1 [Rhipicephalus microplus]|uniref:uncharacterized protein LOC142775757 isoform X1 n=1 Tax=Rhipicephalus microplus TaxID=6941 RepID=UPI003F6C3228